MHLLQFGLLLAALPLTLAPVAARAGDLALRRVMLSTGGVGYFEYEAEVDGTAPLSLDVPLGKVDDVLASLVVFDSAGGVGGVELPGHDGRRAALAGLPLAASALTSALDYLNSLHGVALTVTGPRPMTGRLLHAEQVNEPARAPETTGNTVRRTRVSLLTDAGLQQFVLEDADSVQVADPALREAIARALAALRGESAQATRHLRLRAAGAGTRAVRVGYVAGAPLWKTTYRLILPATDGAPARLQGWAVLENDSAADWAGVDLTLQYGNPVTFRQALYRSYYVKRPEVPVEVLGRILPGVDTGAHPVADAVAPLDAPMAVQTRAAPRTRLMERGPSLAAPEQAVSASEGVEATLFHLPDPVSLPAGHTLTVPILDHAVPAERIGVVQQDRPHPIQAVQLRNDTGSSLPAGILTLYDTTDAAAFAGDARLGGLPVGETRLLQFAEDLRTGVDWRSSGATTLVSVTAADGVLTQVLRNRMTARITLTAPAAEPRRLLLLIPRGGDSTLSFEGDLKPSGETASEWRVPVALAAGESRTVVAYMDRVVREQTGLIDNTGVLAQVLGSQVLSAAQRAALQHIAALRADLAAKQDRMAKLDTQIAAINADEERLRKNLMVTRASDALHGELLRALTADEARIASLTTDSDTARAAAELAHDALAQAVQSLKL